MLIIANRLSVTFWSYFVLDPRANTDAGRQVKREFIEDVGR